MPAISKIVVSCKNRHREFKSHRFLHFNGVTGVLFFFKEYSADELVPNGRAVREQVCQKKF